LVGWLVSLVTYLVAQLVGWLVG